MVIDCDEQYFPSGATATVATIACRAMPGLFNPAQLLRVDMDEITRIVVLIAPHRLGRFQIGQTRQTRTRQNPAYCGLR